MGRRDCPETQNARKNRKVNSTGRCHGGRRKTRPRREVGDIPTFLVGGVERMNSTGEGDVDMR